MAYRVKTVNPQYGMAVNKWFKDVELRRPVADELVMNLQKFRSKTGRPLGPFKEKKPLKDVVKIG